MADLFHKQAEKYAETRPSYPPALFTFIASKTPQRHLAWDAGAGSGQASIQLAGIYKEVVATDTSSEQLSFAPKLPNIRYHHTPPTISLQDIERYVAQPATVDLVIVAQALHWFHLPSFYDQVNFVLKKPHGVFAAWCYTLPRVDSLVDELLTRFYTESRPFWDLARRMVDDEYRSVEFPFDPVDGADGTGPFEFVTERTMDLGAYLTYVRSWSAYQTAREKGVEMLTGEVVGEFEQAWGGDGKVAKVVHYPIFLRIGKVRGGIM